MNIGKFETYREISRYKSDFNDEKYEDFLIEQKYKDKINLIKD